ncbi:DUF2269 family protein [Kordiimonas marina]|uniref:DUF2269 family protein n=1 Tax=Kordiimonas marina TaxID=2872312 RepID=UPI001FF42773|nr:DUF2269 domain-containing protein [Kordiimonas marina]
MDTYSLIKAIHVIGSTVLFGTGLGIAFFMFMGQRAPDMAARVFAARWTVRADYIFTAPAVILQPLTGFWLIHLGGYGLGEPWLVAVYILYLIAGACWLPVVWLQIKMKQMLTEAHAADTPLPETFQRYFRLWFLLGWPAFISLILVFYLMVAKPA